MASGMNAVSCLAPDLNARQWRKTELDYLDDPLQGVPVEQVVRSSRQLPWHGMSLWLQRSDGRDLYIPPAGRHCLILRRGATTGIVQRHGDLLDSRRWNTGEVVLLPAQIPSFWRSELPRDNLHIDLSPQWLERAGGGDARSIRLESCFGRKDILLNQFAQLLLQALDDNTGLNPQFAESISIGLAIHLMEHYRASGASVRVAPLAKRQLKLLEDFVLGNIDQPLPLHALAEQVGLSPYHFARCFKASTGLTCQQFVRKIRMQQARSWLLESRMPISELSLRLGFASASHFSRIFTAHWGETPLSFRKSR